MPEFETLVKRRIGQLDTVKDPSEISTPEELEKKNEDLKKIEESLTEEVLKNEHLDEEKIGPEEWKEIFSAIRAKDPSLLDSFGISSHFQLARFAMGDVDANTTKGKVISLNIIDDYVKNGGFSKRKINKLSNEDKNTLIHEIIKNELSIPIMDAIPLSEIAELPDREIFFKNLAHSHPEQLVINFEQYQKKLPPELAIKVMTDAIYKLYMDEVDALLKEARMSPDFREQAEKINLSRKNPEKMFDRYQQKRDFDQFYKNEVHYMPFDARQETLLKIANTHPSDILEHYFSAKPPMNSDVMATALLKSDLNTSPYALTL